MDLEELSELDDTPRVEEICIVLERGKVFERLIEVFQSDVITIDDNIEIEMVLPNGEQETIDGNTVRRALTEFWNTFYEKCTLGATVKVPYLRQDFREKEWCSVAKIIVFGWLKDRYFPVKLSQTFAVSCLGADVGRTQLLKDFMLYVNEADKNVLKTAINDFQSVNLDELVNVLSNFDAKWLPKRENIYALLLDIAHKDLVQKPLFISECFGTHLKDLLRIDELATIYSEAQGTTESIMVRIATAVSYSPIALNMTHGTVVRIIDSKTGKEKTRLCLNRGKVFEELMGTFQRDMVGLNEEVEVQMIAPTGETEAAQDLGGVLRDSLTEFWNTFYERCTSGVTYKVPCIRHDFRKSEWCAVAKVLVYGWRNENYFPIKLSPSFVEKCFGADSDDNSLFTNFMLHVNEDEKGLFNKALTNFDSVKLTDLVEVLRKFENECIPNKENIRDLLSNIAHKELIQKTTFVSQCFNQYLDRFFLLTEYTMIYKQLEPTADNVILSVSFPDNLTEQMINVRHYTQRFIRESSDEIRAAFLRYCTGSDIVSGGIHVAFMECANDNLRRPVAHTCSGVLEMPYTYESFESFRTEFNNILTSDYWSMDIV